MKSVLYALFVCVALFQFNPSLEAKHHRPHHHTRSGFSFGLNFQTSPRIEKRVVQESYIVSPAPVLAAPIVTTTPVTVVGPAYGAPIVQPQYVYYPNAYYYHQPQVVQRQAVRTVNVKPSFQTHFHYQR